MLISAIAAAILSSAFLPVLPACAAIPHGGFGPTTKTCAICHVPHVAATSSGLFSVPASGSISGEVAVCYSCHDGSGALTNVKTGAVNSFALTSGHRVENTTESAGFAVDLTNRCSSCHAPHADYTTSRRLPKASIVTSSGTAVVSGANNTWCLACHNDARDWYKSTTSTVYPAASSPKVDASGYPVTGTFPGKSVYNDTAKNRHAAIPPGVITDPMVPSQTATRVAGDCLWCHAAHRGKSKYDSLTTTFGAPATSTATLDRTRGDYAAACFTCHGGGSWEASGAVDIKRHAVKSPDDASATSGHRIKTTGAALPLNSPLPCYDCHNPHGSTRQNQMLLSDTLGTQLQATATAGVATTAAGRVREFCFTCHSTSDATAKVWDSVITVYVDTTASMTFQGLRRDGTLLVGQTRPSGYSLNQNYLRLKALGGSDYHAQSSTKNCYDCHGKSYAGASSPNVHAPTMGVSNGGVACYGCHAEYQPMEDNVGAVTGGAARLGSYHHVMGSATNDGDYTPASSTAYPTSVTDVYCLSCHVDHDKFNATKGGNLRATLGSTPATSNTDFNSSTGGICLGCHVVGLTKDFANQKDDGSRRTPTITASGYAGKPHDYAATSSYNDGSTFRANCAKCHSDELTKSYQTSTYKFGTHTSANRRILSALGGTVTDAMEEAVCFKCHSGSSTSDYYASATMDAASRAVNGQITARTYTHDVDNASRLGLHRPDESQTYINANKHVECEDCHNVHAAGATNHTVGGISGNVIGTSSPLYGVWGQNPTYPAGPFSAPSSYAVMQTATREYQICFKCHSGANTNVTTWGGTGATSWTNVAMEFNPNNTSYHPVVAQTTNVSATYAPWMLAPWTNVANQTMMCTDCHSDSSAAASGPHGSTIPHLLKGYWPLNSSNTPYTLAGSKTGLLCAGCHVVGTVVGPAAHRNANHETTPCYGCHIVVPHGGALQGMIGDRDSSMPSRYAFNNTKTNLLLSGYSGNGDSRSSTCNAQSGCSQHSNAVTNW